MRILLFAALAVLAPTACGDGGNTGAETQPAPDVTTFVEGDFGDIPLPPLAEPAGERSERNDVTARSFFVRNTTPKQVLAFYDDYFRDEGTPVIASPAAAGTAWRGSWLLDGRELLVSAIPAPTAEGGEEVEHADVVTQLDLELSPADGGGHEGGPADRRSDAP